MIVIIMGQIPTGGGGSNRGEKRKMLKISGDRTDRTCFSMITYSAENASSDTVYCLFGYLFSIFLNTSALSFGVIMIPNELSYLMFSYHCFRIPKILFFLALFIGAAVGST